MRYVIDCAMSYVSCVVEPFSRERVIWYTQSWQRCGGNCAVCGTELCMYVCMYVTEISVLAEEVGRDMKVRKGIKKKKKKD